MLFNFFLLIVWLLAYVSPVGDYQKYLKSLADDRIAPPDIPRPIAMAPKLVDSVLTLVPAPAPVPVPRFSPLVIPVYHGGKGKEDGLGHFRREKRVVSIRRWLDNVTNTLANSIGRPRPTKAAYPPTKTHAPNFTTSPTFGRQVPADWPIHYSSSTEFDLGELLYAYRLGLVWMAATFLITVLIFARFIGHPASDKVEDLRSDLSLFVTQVEPALAPESEQFASIIDIYCELGFPPVVDNDTASASSYGSENAELTANDVDGSDGVSMSAAPLESAASSNSIGTSFVGLNGRRSAFMTPSPSSFSIGPSASDILSRYPATGQVHTPRTKRWLEGLVTRVQEMERQGNHHGRVYDGWAGNLDLDSTDRSESGERSFEAGLSTTVSQDSLYGGLMSMVD